MVYNNQLVCYYSDERDPAHNQKLVYVTTSDLKNWSAIQPSVVMSEQNARPGMATVSKIPNGWIMSYELCNDPSGRSEFLPKPIKAASLTARRMPRSLPSRFEPAWFPERDPAAPPVHRRLRPRGLPIQRLDLHRCLIGCDGERCHRSQRR